MSESILAGASMPKIAVFSLFKLEYFTLRFVLFAKKMRRAIFGGIAGG